MGEEKHTFVSAGGKDGLSWYLHGNSEAGAAAC